MTFKERELIGVFEITPKILDDERGFFMRSYDRELFDSHGAHQNWVQENHSKTNAKGTIRGLHFQFPPFSEAKLIRCIKGAIINVFVDLRKNSTTFGKWGAVELNQENKKMTFIPRGFANGFYILKDNSELIYKSDNYYNSEYEGQIIWNDPDINIKWPISNPILSEKDKNNGSFSDFISNYKFLDI